MTSEAQHLLSDFDRWRTVHFELRTAACRNSESDSLSTTSNHLFNSAASARVSRPVFFLAIRSSIRRWKTGSSFPPGDMNGAAARRKDFGPDELPPLKAVDLEFRMIMASFYQSNAEIEG
jgi:hypothetical protein